MSGRIRQIICEKISHLAKPGSVYHELEVPARRKQNAAGPPVLQWTLANQDDAALLRVLASIAFPKEYVDAVRVVPAAGKTAAKVEFQLRPEAFVQSILQQSGARPAAQVPEHIVVEFSSPNIAKPFHVGHLRSTIIGNVVGNLHAHFGYKVTKLNYLGDWGTQFGMLQVGVQMDGVTDEQMRRNPIQTLYRAYVAANQAAKSDPTIAAEARKYFTALETGTDTALARQWQAYRGYTIAELEQVYARLGVHFDQYDWESQYSQQQIGDILERLTQHALLHDEPDGRRIVQVDGRRVPIIKSDGSTLYLARDIAALVDRFRRFQFERIFYVVDNAQTDHFNACFKTTAALCDEIPLERLKHVKFGRIHGMSTRNGKAVFLRDVLDEARDIMHEKQLNSPTTKVDLSDAGRDPSNAGVSDVLAVSAVIINDLKQRRQRDYDFDWNKVLQVNGDTGIKIQYTHCRLYNLLENVADVSVDSVAATLEHLSEPEAQDLIYEIARFDQAVWQAKEQLEACILVNYLFSLCNSTSRALKRLNVKHEASLEKQQNRILLFAAAKDTLNRGMQILGLRPLNKM